MHGLRSRNGIGQFGVAFQLGYLLICIKVLLAQIDCELLTLIQ